MSEPSDLREEVESLRAVVNNLAERVFDTRAADGAFARAEKAEAELARVNAQAAAMRAALEWIERETHQEDGRAFESVHARAADALAGDAGRGWVYWPDFAPKVQEKVTETVMATVRQVLGETGGPAGGTTTPPKLEGPGIMTKLFGVPAKGDPR